MCHIGLGNKLASRVYLFIWCCVYRYLRSVAYREFSRLVYGYLGKKRIPLPACAYTAIRKAFPVQENETLTGFEVEDLVDWKMFYIMVILLLDHQIILLFWFQSNVGCSFLACLLFYTNMILFFLLVVSNTANVLDKISVQPHTLSLLCIQVSTVYVN